METFAYNPDATLYYFAFDRSTGYVYVSNGASSGAFADASWDTYDVSMTERGTSSGIYELAKSAGLSASVCYDIVIYEQAGASPAITDQMVGVGTLGPATDGVLLAAAGLDAISTTAPTGVASNFREMVVQTWRRFFKKTTLTSTQLKTYADDGSTVLTTQPVSDDGATQTQGASS